ncbi:hypothetical protein [Candidatus Enterococcus ikei]|uniref:Integral membrane protein n=1 Tax=Candidatus Enterococcus ikei TaxID=2815326 RepID=A0ABS3GYF8_9ENTE|nr:hypothetical protein [Enterococcus sp. DIV0869a]
MSKFKLMNASFEESLNLSDDSLISFMEKDTSNRGIYNGKNKIGITIIAIIMFSFNFFISMIVQIGIDGKLGESTLPQPDINFLPLWVPIGLLIIWLVIWLLLKRNNYYRISIYRRMLTINNYMIWLILEANLFFLTFFLTTLTFFGAVAIFCFLALTGYIIFRSKARSLENNLFGEKLKLDKIDDFIQKIINFLFKYGWIVVIIVILWKFIFPNTTGVRTDIVGLVGVIAMWLIVDIAFIFAEAYLFLPYLLYGYYKNKYPEEYRKWEGKTQLEWYGEKYFNKHIKGTEKEEKTND